MHPRTVVSKRCFLSFNLIFFVVIIFSSKISAQSDSTFGLTFDFNDQQIKEKDNKTTLSSNGVFLTNDRFGNEKSAVYIKGDNTCYLSLGSLKLLKSSSITISFWVNLDRRNYIGRGNDSNPMMASKNRPGEDYTNAIFIGYVPFSNQTGYIGVNTTKDSLHEVTCIDGEPFQFGKWYHFVVVCNNQYLALYANGELKQKTWKNFETQFYELDSMLVGHSGSKKNERMSIGTFDDIQIFHRSLKDQEIENLYNAPNPNRFRNFFNELLKYGLITLGFIIIIVFLIFRNKRALKKQKEQLELVNKVSELELKVVKAQMNPHFISNCLAAIQDLIYRNEIEKGGLYIAKFSYFLRQVLNHSDEDFITITKEIEIIRLYVELEQLRFKNAFDFKFFIDENIDCKETLIPSMITQPFIENAIWHGLLPLGRQREPKLSIQIFPNKEFLFIEIEDNGVGRNFAKHSNNKSKGIGLVIDKMESLNRLSKGNHFKIEILDLKDEKQSEIGTKIRIQLNYLKE